MTNTVLTIREAEDGTFEVERTTPDLSEADGMNFSYGVLADLKGAGATLAKGVVPAGVRVPNHAGPNPYALLVISGQGELIMNTKKGDEVLRLDYRPGLLILFPPSAHHDWINSSEDQFEWFGVDVLPEGSE